MIDLSPGALYVNRYQIEQPLGQGGLGRVYRAVDTQTGEQVVIKEYRDQDTSPLQETTAFRLVYPELYLDAGVDSDDHGYIVTKWLPGRASGKLPAALVEAVMRDVLTDLDVLHRQRWTHRDIKPANIYIGADRSRLLDFGQAGEMLSEAEERELETASVEEEEAEKSFNALAASLGRRGVDALDLLKAKHQLEVARERLFKIAEKVGFSGTEDYAPPEQLGETKRVYPIDARTDIYELGATAFALLTGDPPSGCEAQMYDTHVPPHLAAVIAKALACDPDARYPSATAMLADLRPDLRHATQVNGGW